jgi:hypothetical protein
MTGTAAQRARPTCLADVASPYPVAVLAAIGLVAGWWWFPAWFLAAQLVRTWSTRGGVTWLSSRGFPEYTDEQYGRYIGYAPIALIALRIVLSLNWLEPFQIIAAHKAQTGADTESYVFVAIILGLALAVALTGVLRAHGLPWPLAAAGFVAVAVLALGSYGAIWNANALTAVPLVALGYLTSKIALVTNRVLDNRAARRAEETPQDQAATTSTWHRPRAGGAG